MTEPTVDTTHAPDLQDVRAQLEAQQRTYREQRDAVDRVLNSPAAEATARYLHDDGNGIGFRQFLREIGGALRLDDYLEDGRPDPARINPVIDRIFNRTAVTELQGGITMTVTPTHPVTRL
ncbi:hypothetical protein [Streptomyces sp. NPDC059787]|uniref:hypothetical protein n=1 Tax=Streptomyces sp. NPDC059787 TaxID=3346947 RepID=UPI003656C4DA